MSTGVSSKVNQKETRLPDDFVHLHPVAKKLTEPRTGVPAAHTNANKYPLAHKVNVPDEESRISVRQIEKERQDRHHMPHKITQQTRYGEYPNYKMSQDRVYVRPQGPDANQAGLQDKITSSPSRIKVFPRGT